MRKILEKRLARLIAKRDDLTKRGLASEDAAEVRAINEQLAELNADISDIQEELDALMADETATAEAEARAAVPPADAQPVNAGIVASFSSATAQQRSDESPLESAEYRTVNDLVCSSSVSVWTENGIVMFCVRLSCLLV